MKKLFIVIFICFLSTPAIYSQVFSINDTISMEVVSVKLKKTAMNDGIQSAGKGKRFLELKITYYSNSKKRVKINYWRMVFKIEGEEQIAQRDAGWTPLEEKNYYFKFKKEETRKLFANVSENFTNGELYYYGKLLGTIKISKGEKEGVFIPTIMSQED